MDPHFTRYGFRCCSSPKDPINELGEDELNLDTFWKTAQQHIWTDEGRPVIPLCHQGQRKLLFAELHFFHKCCEREGPGVNLTQLTGTVVYAGAANGIHIPILASMVPKLKWILFDPSPFHKTVLSDKRFICINNKFDVSVAKKHIGKSSNPVWFISDIRSNNSDEGVTKDMELQSLWIKKLNPKLASLKFRLPFSNIGSLKSKQKENIKEERLLDYLDGDLYAQVNAPAYSSEARLITDATRSVKTYSVLKHETRMQGYNYYTRNMRFIVPEKWRDVVLCVPGYDNGFESMIELSLLPQTDIEYVVNFERKMLEATNRHLSICATTHPLGKRMIAKGFASVCALQSLNRKSLRLDDIKMEQDTKKWINKEIDTCKNYLIEYIDFKQHGGTPSTESRTTADWGTFTHHIENHTKKSNIERKPGIYLYPTYINKNGTEIDECKLNNETNALKQLVDVAWRSYWEHLSKNYDTKLYSTFTLCLSRYRKNAPLSDEQTIRVLHEMAFSGDAESHNPSAGRKNQVKKDLIDLFNSYGLDIPNIETNIEYETKYKELANKKEFINSLIPFLRQMSTVINEDRDNENHNILTLFTRKPPHENGYIIDPFPPAMTNGLHPIQGWNIFNNKAIISLLIRADQEITTHVILPETPNNIKRFKDPNEPENFDAYLGFMDVVLDNNEHKMSKYDELRTTIFNRCGVNKSLRTAQRLRNDGKVEDDDNLFRKRIYFFKRHVYINGRNTLGYPIELGDVFERRSTLYHELVQIMYIIQQPENKHFSIFVNVLKPEFVIANKEKVNLFTYRPTQGDFEWMINGEFTWLNHMPKAAVNGPNIFSEVESIHWKESIWVSVLLDWNETTANIGFSFRDSQYTTTQSYDKISFKNRYAHSLIQSEKLGGGIETKNNTLKRLLNEYNETFMLYKRNTARISDYANRLKNMHLTTNDTLSRVVGTQREIFPELIDPDNTLVPAPYTFMPPETSPDELTNKSKVLMISGNFRLAQRILELRDVYMDIIGIAGKLFRDMGTIESFLKNKDKCTFKWGGLFPDEWLFKGIKNVNIYDYIVIDLGSNFDCTETLNSIEVIFPRLKENVCINIFCDHPRTESAVIAMKKMTINFKNFDVITNWYAAQVTKNIKTFEDIPHLMGAHVFWGGLNKTKYNTSSKKESDKFEEGIFLELDKRKTALEKTFWFFLQEESKSSGGRQLRTSFLPHVAAFGVLVITSVLAIFHPRM